MLISDINWDRFCTHAKLVMFGPKTGCIEWQMAPERDGYGTFKCGRTTCLVHRISYQYHYGDVGDKCVCHSCDNRLCVNPMHLWLGTTQDNTADMVKKDRQSRETSYKLNETRAGEIRRLRANGWLQQALADKYGVSRPTIRAVLMNKSYKIPNG